MALLHDIDIDCPAAAAVIMSVYVSQIAEFIMGAVSELKKVVLVLHISSTP